MVLFRKLDREDVDIARFGNRFNLIVGESALHALDQVVVGFFERGRLNDDERGRTLFGTGALVDGYEVELGLIEAVARLIPEDFRDFGFANFEDVELAADEGSNLLDDASLSLGAGKGIDQIGVGNFNGSAVVGQLFRSGPGLLSIVTWCN